MYHLAHNAMVLLHKLISGTWRTLNIFNSVFIDSYQFCPICSKKKLITNLTWYDCKGTSILWMTSAFGTMHELSVISGFYLSKVITFWLIFHLLHFMTFLQYLFEPFSHIHYSSYSYCNWLLAWTTIGSKGNMLCSRGSVVVKALCYKPEGRGFDTQWGEFLNLSNPSGRNMPWDLLSL
jgi:hypothetical protein